MSQMTPMLNIAIRAARRAGNILLQGYQRNDEVIPSQKGINDYVTNFDRASEKAIIDLIRQSYPNHVIIGEENGLLEGSEAEYQWIIDPLDGTRNFMNGFPHFSVSIALRVKNRTEVGVVYNPITNELFSAVRGRGAKLNETRLRVNPRTELKGSILTTGFPFKNANLMAMQFTIMENLARECADFRRTGSAALDLCYVASNRTDGYFEMGVKPWDICAGELIVREAGGLVCDFFGRLDYLAEEHIIATSPRMVKSIISHIHPVLPENFKVR